MNLAKDKQQKISLRLEKDELAETALKGDKYEKIIN